MDGLGLILSCAPKRALSAAVMLASLTVAAPVHADVLEIGADGAQWVAGGPATPAATTTSPPAIPASQAIVIQDRVDPAISPVVLAEVEAVGVPAIYASKVAEVCTRYDLSPALFEALVWQESRWRHRSVSPKGARGLAQLMPATARYLRVNPDDPYANLEGGARYLREQLNRFDGNLEKALAAYNAGPARVQRAGGIPRIRETQLYVRSIMGRLAAHYRNRENGTT